MVVVLGMLGTVLVYGRVSSVKTVRIRVVDMFSQGSYPNWVIRNVWL